jgi:hypothetical protein
MHDPARRRVSAAGFGGCAAVRSGGALGAMGHGGRFQTRKTARSRVNTQVYGNPAQAFIRGSDGQTSMVGYTKRRFGRTCTTSRPPYRPKKCPGINPRAVWNAESVPDVVRPPLAYSLPPVVRTLRVSSCASLVVIVIPFESLSAAGQSQCSAVNLPPAARMSARSIATGLSMIFMKLWLPIMERSGKFSAIRKRAYNA